MDSSKFLSLAAKQARLGSASGDGGPFGAVIVRRNVVIARAHNTVLKDHLATRHAEVNAIALASKKLKRHLLTDCVIYTTTEPCPMCFSAIHWAQIKSAYYSTSIQDVQRLGFNELSIPARQMKRLGKSKLTLKRVANKECREVLKFWRSLEHKQTY